MYVPKFNSRMGYTLAYLALNWPEAKKVENIIRATGLKEATKTSRYSDRANYYFGCVIVPVLCTQHKYIEKVKHGHYRITELGRHVFYNYIKGMYPLYYSHLI